MIRLAEEKDFLQLAQMKWEHSAEDDITYGETNTVGVNKQDFIEDYITFLKNDSTYTIFVLEQDGIVISAMYVAIIDKIPKPNAPKSYIAYLTNVHTMSKYRNKGYGTELLSYIKKYLKDKGCELIFVWPSDNSVNWYQRNGFNSENDIMECEF